MPTPPRRCPTPDDVPAACRPARRSRIAPAGLTALALATALRVAAAPGPVALAVATTDYPGTIELQVDATDQPHRLFHVRERIPAAPGALRLSYPRWLPGGHAPYGSIGRLLGLTIETGGRRLDWQRDPLDPYSFSVEVPPGTTGLDLSYDIASAVSPGQGRVVLTPELASVQWIALTLYPSAWADTAITVRPSVRLNAGWQVATALEAEPAQRRDGGGADAGRGADANSTLIRYRPVRLGTLFDSPLLAGMHATRLDLDPEAAARGRPPVMLDVFADTAAEAVASPQALAAHRALVTQADRVFGERRFAHYDFLLSISDELGGIGLEHHQSSENGVRRGYFVDWQKSATTRELLSHEYVHSWNGKFRRPADLWSANPNQPMRDSLLWVYEGQTQFWGWVLAARSGLVPAEATRTRLAEVAAHYASQPGREWRSLQDTTQQPLIEAASHADTPWPDWQRGTDYYDAMVLVWLEADLRIRERSGGSRSLDDFARAFFGAPDGAGPAQRLPEPLTYTFDDVVAALERTAPGGDWRAFLRERLDARGRDGAGQPALPASSGWRLGWADTPDAAQKERADLAKRDDFIHSIGLQVAREDKRIARVAWGGPAFAAGLAPGARLIAVDGLAYSAERLRDALVAARTSGRPIELIVQDQDRFRVVPIAYTGGPRHPRLERIADRPDRLAQVLAARAAAPAAR